MLSWKCSLRRRQIDVNGAEIDRNRNIAIINILKRALFSSDNTMRCIIITSDGYFNFCVLLSILLDFCEYYKSVVINTCYELILIRARNDTFSDFAFSDWIDTWIIQNTTANASRYVEWNQKTIYAVYLGKRTISEYEFPFVGFVWVSFITKYDKVFVDYQDYNSAGKT